ncbi:ATP-dependent DNA helicase RecG [Selenomonas sp. oral taxon 138]|uniref:ATP-dependent DNA helicase RecG n=1 Tax=Selenomonas sp. oral taxon 138 TaxID=712532 RepID=UPI0002A2C6F3|nr:ATP-dependent DNA helicase RecG [Selenomonas sp. oral taxon 138]EKY01453.1 ATP-dependent DNA helicase RecG [Selenomonas sp. oral taxon 138 str. F0429]
MKLSDSINKVRGVGVKKAAAFARLGIQTVYDLLTYYPRAYEDQSRVTPIAQLRAGERATVLAVIQRVTERQARRRGFTVLTALLGDETGYAQAVWFNQRFLKTKLREGRRILLTGKADYAYNGGGQLALTNITSFELLGAEEDAGEHLGILPVYAATEGLTQKQLRAMMEYVLLQTVDELEENLPQRVREEYRLIGRRSAFRHIHFPKEEEELRTARRRLAFEELYLIQCGLLALKKRTAEEQEGIAHSPNGALVERVRAALPFTLTADQGQVWGEITHDMESPLPMRRLVQGDVGSGKTAIALLALVKTVESGHQGAMMAPTEILARQHYDYLRELLTPLGVRVGFLSGRLTKKERTAMDAALAVHEVDIAVGTHALIQDHVAFAALGLVVTDEQHRFGVAQRAELEKKSERTPDVLVMTATPIPRTMTLTVYGDLDVSRIEHLPPGRQPIRTFLRDETARAKIYAFVRREIESGRQAYVVCPLIEASEEMDLPSAEAVYEELAHGIFRGIPCGLLHGRMKSAEKEAVMDDFYANRVKLLVSTTVIEVGVNVPNASILVVEHAERFGLSQLHQLRGRVGRGAHASYCILIAGRSAASQERLQVIEQTSDGFRLAEEDLRLRGPGQFFGAMQHGLGDLKIADVLADMDLLLLARRAALATMDDPAALSFVLPTLMRQYRERFAHMREV